eukprot:gene9719-10710_t
MAQVRWISSLRSSNSIQTCFKRITPTNHHILQQNQNQILILSSSQVRWYQKPPEQPGLLKRFIDNIREGISRDKALQENLKKFQDEAKKYEESEALKSAKQRMSLMGKIKDNVKPYSEKISESIRSSSKTMSSTMGKVYDDAKESDVFKKSREISEELGKSAKDAAEKLAKQSEEIEKTDAFKTASKAYKTVEKELFEEIKEASKPYQRPEVLRKRTLDGVPTEEEKSDKEFDPNTDATGMVLHAESKWSQQWKDFKDNNAVVNGLFSLKMKYDESDNIMIRATRVVTDKFADVFRDVFSQSEMAATLAEIAKIDPNFNKDKFLKECEREIIPTVLEAFIRGELDVLKDWCHEGAFNVLSEQIKHNKSIGKKIDSKILDIRDVDLALAKIMEQGPVLIMTFVAQQTVVVRNSAGGIIEGKEDNIENVHYIWAMCRDQTIYDPRQAWRVLEFGGRVRKGRRRRPKDQKRGVRRRDKKKKRREEEQRKAKAGDIAAN